MVKYPCCPIGRPTAYAGVMELADVTDSKSVDGDIVWVRVPPPAPKRTASLADAVLFAVVWGKEATRSKVRKKRDFSRIGEWLAPRRKPRRGLEFYHHHRHQKERHPHGCRSFCRWLGQRSHTQQGEEEKKFCGSRRAACPEAKAEEGFRVPPPAPKRTASAWMPFFLPLVGAKKPHAASRGRKKNSREQENGLPRGKSRGGVQSSTTTIDRPCRSQNRVAIPWGKMHSPTGMWPVEFYKNGIPSNFMGFTTEIGISDALGLAAPREMIRFIFYILIDQFF